MDGQRAYAAPLLVEAAMFASATAGIRKWLVALFVEAIKRTAHPEDRHAVLVWLLRCRDILAGDLGHAETLKALNEQIKARSAVSAIAAQVADAVREYRTANLPWAVKIAIPATLLAMPVVGLPVVGLQDAGVAALGTAMGLPALLVVFLGTAGITAVIEGVVAHPLSATGITLIAARILRAEASRRAARWFTDEMLNDPVAPCAAAMPKEEAAIRAALLALDPHSFETHVMSFFERAGLQAVVTPKGKDQGLDGYAHHPEGLIVVQCKRYGMENRVGSPAIQQFRTVMTDGNAWRGYVVTTSCFTAGAVSCAMKEKSLILIDLDALVRWHTGGFTIAA